ncbi:MAG TPA: hypothetical protein VL354_18560 [Spirochaetia bacterium]|nr:hypothetical protein [Spirochaetia bacterium]
MKEKGMLNTLLRPDTGTKRLRYLDNLRSLVIFFVAVMHSDVTYSGVGGWYYTEDNPALRDWLEVVQEKYGDIEMNTVEEKEIESCMKAKKRGTAAGRANLKQDIQPSMEEQQVAELERTFSDRWEW